MKSFINISLAFLLATSSILAPFNSVSAKTTNLKTKEIVLNEAEGTEGESGEVIVGETEYNYGDFVETNGEGFDFINPINPSVYLYEVSQDTPEPLFDQKTINNIQSLISNTINAEPIDGDELLGLMSSENKLLYVEKNNPDLYSYEIIASNSDRSDYIFVVDKDAVVFAVRDKDGNGIPNAKVSISYIENESRVNRTIYTTDGVISGVAAFDNMEATRYGVVDIEAAGYHSVTLFDDELTGGKTKNFILQKENNPEVYVRAVDIDGKDLVNSDTTLSLIENDLHPLRFSIVLSKTDGATLPKEVKLVSLTDGRVIHTFMFPKQYKSTSDSCIFTYNGYWVSQSGPLKENDRLALQFGDQQYELKNVIVENAPFEPSYDPEKEMEFADDGLVSGDADASSIIDMFNVAIAPLKMNVAVGILPSGNFYIMVAKQIETFSHDWPELFNRSYSPKAAEKTGTIMQQIKESTASSFDNAAKKMSNILGSESTFLFDPTYGALKSTISAMISGGYNAKEKRFEGDATFGFSFTAMLGKQGYVAIGCIPVNFGAELSFNASAKFCPAVNATSIIPIKDFEVDRFRTKYINIHAGPTLKLFACAGVHNAVGVEALGTVGVDYGYVVHKGDKGNVKLPSPHKFLDFSANLSINIYALLMTKTFSVWDIYQKRWCDNWEDYVKPDSLMIADVPFKPLDLNIGKEKVVENLTAYSKDDGTLESYYLDVPVNNRPSGLKLVSSDSFIDNQIQLVSTVNTTALFRLIAKDGTTKLVYQLEDKETGEFENILHEVPMPIGDGVYEFNVTGQKNEMHKVPSGYVYIAAVTGDVDSDDPDTRAHSTNVVGIVIDIDEGKLVNSKVVAEAKDDAFYYGVIPAHYTNDLVVAYREAKSYDTTDVFKNYLVSLDGSKTLLSENVPVYSSNICSPLWISTFWTVDTTNTDPNKFNLIGYNHQGGQRAYKEDDKDESHIWNNFKVSFDVSEFREKFPTENPFACNGYLYGKEYMIVGGNLYQLKVTDSTKPIELVNVDTSRFSDINFTGAYGHYQMLTNYKQGTLFITCLKGVYDTEENSSVPVLMGSELQFAYIIEETDHYGTTTMLHGPRTYMIEKLEASKYTCGFNSASLGVELVVDSLHDDNKNSVDVYSWSENAGYGLSLTDMYLDNNIIFNNQQYIKAYITYTNSGYGKADVATIKVTDSLGEVLPQVSYDAVKDVYYDLGDITGYSYELLYPADTVTIPIFFKVNPNWNTNTTYSIIVSMLNENKETVSQAALLLDKPYLNFAGRQEVLNGDHYLTIDISNESVVTNERGKLVLIGVYDVPEKNAAIDVDCAFDGENILEVLALGKGAFANSKDDAKLKYNATYDVEEMWLEYKDKGLLAVNVYLIDNDGKLLSENVVTIKNPYYRVVENIDDPSEEKPPVKPTIPTTPTNPVEPDDGVEEIENNQPENSETDVAQPEEKPAVLIVDGKYAKIGDKLTVSHGIKGYLVYLSDANEKEMLIGIISEDYTTLTLFDTEFVSDKENHEATIVYPDGNKKTVKVVVEEKQPEVQPKKSIVPMVLVSLSLLLVIIIIFYKSKKKKD